MLQPLACMVNGDGDPFPCSKSPLTLWESMEGHLYAECETLRTWPATGLRRAKEKLHVAVSPDVISQCLDLTQLAQGPVPLPLYAPLSSVLCAP